MWFDPTYFASLQKLSEQLSAQFAHLPQEPSPYPTDLTALEGVLQEAMTKMGNNYPYFHSQYAGQMLKPPHPVAQMAYFLSMHINPNNHALDGGRASSAMEKEAVADLAQMMGYTEHLGHLTSGGTMANLEALWVARQSAPGKAIAVSEQAHYTHERMGSVLGLEVIKIKVDAQGRMDLNHLETLLQEHDHIGTVVATLGTTLCGAVDPLSELLTLKDRYPFRIHVDTAYGGYFKLLSDLPTSAQAAFDAIHQADSIVIDPHKHGLQPYGCGCVLFKDPKVGRFYQHDSPYTYFSSDELHLGEISLECSRAGSSAVALWATQKLLPLTPDGQFAQYLHDARQTALNLAKRLEADPDFELLMQPELDIVIWAFKGKTYSKSSALASRYFHQAEQDELFLALAQISGQLAPADRFQANQKAITCLRSCLMKPLSNQQLDQLWGKMQTTKTKVLDSE